MQVEIIILKEEVLHHVKADINQLERVRKMEDMPILTGSDSDNYIVNRFLDQAVSAIVARMQAYVVAPNSYAHRIANDHTRDWQERSIVLQLPQTWPPSCMEPLKNAVHDYVVSSTVFNVASKALPNDPALAIVNEQAKAAYNEVNALINTRLGGVHIHPGPFG